MKPDPTLNPPGWQARLVGGLYDRRRLVWAACALLTALAAVPAARVGVDNGVHRWFTEGDPALQAYLAFQRTFGNDETVLLALHRDEGMLTPDGLAALRRVTEAVRRIEGVADVTSLATMQEPRPGLLGPRLAPLLPEGPVSLALAARLRERILRDTAGFGRLVSADSRTAVLLARMGDHEGVDARRSAILTAIDRAAAGSGVRFHKAGSGVIVDALNRAATEDAVLLVLAAHLLIFVLLWGLYRNLRAVLLTLAVVGMATTWLIGLYGLAGRSLNLVTMVLPTLVLVIGTAGCVHLLLHTAGMPPAPDRRARVVGGILGVLRPCAANTLTTVLGFLSLVVSPMPVIRDLGLFAALGVLLGAVAALLLCTGALASPRVEPVATPRDLLVQVVQGLAGFGLRHRRGVLVAAAGLALVAALGLPRLVTDTNALGYFPADHPVRRDAGFIEQHLGPYLPLEFVVRAPEGALRPDLFRAVDAWQRRVEQAGTAGWSRSPVDAVKRLRGALPGGKPEVPESPRQLEGLTRLGATGPEPAFRELAAHPGLLRVTFGVPAGSTGALARTTEAIRAAAHLPDGVTVAPSGYLPLYVRMMALVVRSQAESFALAFCTIFVMIGLLLRSARAALVSLLPNGLPLLLTLGGMGFAGIPLDAATITIAAIVLGLVVDDTVHLLYRYRHERPRHADAAGALRRCAVTTGRAVVTTTLVLVLGFAVLGLAQVKSVAWFGGLSAFALAAAFLTDVIVLPALLATLDARSARAEALHAAPVSAT